MTKRWEGPLERLDPYRWRIPDSYRGFMRVPGIIYASEDMLEDIKADQAPEQVTNVASLPGIVGASLAMPDIHWGYGFPIGGVAATSWEGGVISPGGIGFDICCGVRILRTNLTEDDVRPRLKELVGQLFRDIPAGLGSEGRLTVKGSELDEVLLKGAAWAVEKGYGRPEDLDFTEDQGCLLGADPGRVSKRAKQRGAPQLGTLGSGNHFVEISVVDQVFNERVAREFGLYDGQVVLQIHTGSRGLGHQVCTDYLSIMDQALSKYGIHVPDRQLACAPLDSKEGKDYMAAMAAAANFAWANRQILSHWARESMARFFGKRPEDLDLSLLYDQAHNIAKMEEHEVAGRRARLCVHRKGASRAFPAGRCELPSSYISVGQPVLVPGDMGRASYVLVGLPGAMAETFGSASHGAGRVLSRAQAKKGTRGSELKKELLEKGIVVRGASDASLAEEAPEAYKDVSRVVEVMHRSGLAAKVVRMRPIGVIKG